MDENGYALVDVCVERTLRLMTVFESQTRKAVNVYGDKSEGGKANMLSKKQC